VPEIALCRWWNRVDLTRPLRTVDGRSLTVIFRGRWSHGLGPDFQEAMIEFDGSRLVTGSVEIHRDSAAWQQHGHHLDVRYNEVILHAVLTHGVGETRRSDGKIVPILILEPGVADLTDLASQPVDWSCVGGEVCARHVAFNDPRAVRSVLWNLGDRRLAAKAAQIEGVLTEIPPSEALYEILLEGLGYSENREPMQKLARLLPLQAFEPLLATAEPTARYPTALGLLLGVAGFLPLSPLEADAASISQVTLSEAEAAWQRLGGAWHADHLPSTTWNRIRVRPSNHPLLRLAMTASIVANAKDGLEPTIIAALRNGEDPVVLLIRLSSQGNRTPMGRGRAIAMAASGILPFCQALAAATDDQQLSEAASMQWERLQAGESNRVTRRAMKQVSGDVRLARLGERGMQGLIHLDRSFCQPRRCHECSIAALALKIDEL
jgi:hypothetical protein